MRKSNTRKPTLSPTKISIYLTCRLMYKYTYIDKIGRFYYQPKAYHSFGTSLHRTLEQFHQAGGAQTQSPDDLVRKLHEVWAPLGYASAAEENKHIEIAEQLLAEYYTSYDLEGVRTLFTEKSLKCDMGEFNLMGRLDRLDEHSDGSLEIIDYKSGRITVTEEDVGNDLAMSIYAYLVHRAFPDREVRGTVHALRSGEKATVLFSEEDFQEIEEHITAIAADILRIDEDSYIEPVWLPHVCPQCDYLRLCARTMDWDVPALIARHDA